MSEKNFNLLGQLNISDLRKKLLNMDTNSMNTFYKLKLIKLKAF